MTKCSFKIEGLCCVEEVTSLKRVVGPLVGGEDGLAFDVLNARMTIPALPANVSVAEIVTAVATTGMRAEPWQAESADPPSKAGVPLLRPMLTAVSGVLALVALIIHAQQEGGFAAAMSEGGQGHALAVPLVVRGLYLVSVFCGVWMVLPKAWYSLRALRPDMNLLMVVAVAGAVAIGEWFEAATVSFLFALSLLLESWSVGRARRAVEALLDLSPPTARIKELTGSRDVPVAEVPVGSLIIVKPGERIPLDGRIVRGASSINQAPITGESMPVAKESEDEVFAGTINGDGTLEIKTKKAATDTTLALIIRLVSEARSRRSASEQWVDRFARWYTPAVMILAVLVFILPPLLFAQPWSVWLYRALVLLVIACPCALVISTPVSIVAALAAAAKNGVLIKGGAFIEIPARLKAIAFDKTGTLTRGQPAVQKIVPLSGHDERELLERAAALEANSNHPIAHAVLEAASRRGIKAAPAENLKILQGKGAVGQINGRTFWLGSHRLLEERGQETPELHQQLITMSEAGHTVVVIGNESHVCGLIAVADAIKPGAAEVIADLRRLGIERLVMMSGDNEPTAIAIAAQVGVTEVQAELLPQDKVDAVENLVSTLGAVAMVGDGVNDAPALARATLGIAMGAAGSDAAIEAADVALMSDDLAKLPWLIRHSRRTLSIIRQNIIFALAIKVGVVVLTLTGSASLWAAIAADVGASLLVVVNGLRLLRGGTNVVTVHSLPHAHSIAGVHRPHSKTAAGDHS